MYRKHSGVIDLSGKICLVTGGSQGIGKGIAVQLAYYGATCYVTGRNKETLDLLTAEVEQLGGSGNIIPVQCDHTDDDGVEKVFERISDENEGKLDLLVNNAYSAVSTIFENRKQKFWEQPLETWDITNNVGLRNHYRCAIHASKMMVEKRKGLIINISSIGGLRYLFSVPYGVGKCAKDRMAQDCAVELKKYKVAFVSLWPGLVRTEKVTKLVKHDDIDGNDVQKLFKPAFEVAETPTFVGRTVAALLSEPHGEVMEQTGKILLTCDIGRKHGITDENGLVPANVFQLNSVLRITGHNWLANFIPNFIRIPFFVARMAEAYKHC